MERREESIDAQCRRKEVAKQIEEPPAFDEDPDHRIAVEHQRHPAHEARRALGLPPLEEEAARPLRPDDEHHAHQEEDVAHGEQATVEKHEDAEHGEQQPARREADANLAVVCASRESKRRERKHGGGVVVVVSMDVEMYG